MERVWNALSSLLVVSLVFSRSLVYLAETPTRAYSKLCLASFAAASKPADTFPFPHVYTCLTQGWGDLLSIRPSGFGLACHCPK